MKTFRSIGVFFVFIAIALGTTNVVAEEKGSNMETDPNNAVTFFAIVDANSFQTVFTSTIGEAQTTSAQLADAIRPDSGRVLRITSIHGYVFGSPLPPAETDYALAGVGACIPRVGFRGFGNGSIASGELSTGPGCQFIGQRSALPAKLYSIQSTSADRSARLSAGTTGCQELIAVMGMIFKQKESQTMNRPGRICAIRIVALAVRFHSLPAVGVVVAEIDRHPPPTRSTAIADATTASYILDAADFSAQITFEVTPAVDAGTGVLRRNAYVSKGESPVSVTIDPSGQHAYVSNSLSDDVSAYAIDAASGTLSPLRGSPFMAGKVDFQV